MSYDDLGLLVIIGIFFVVPLIVCFSCKWNMKRAVKKVEILCEKQKEEVSAFQKEMYKEWYVIQEKTLEFKKELFAEIDKIKEILWRN